MARTAKKLENLEICGRRPPGEGPGRYLPFRIPGHPEKSTRLVLRRLAAILLLFLSQAGAEEKIHRTFAGVEVLYPGATARHIGNRLGFIFDLQFRQHGHWHPEGSGYGLAEWDFRMLGRLHLLHLGKSLKVHVTAGAVKGFPYYLGSGLSMYKEIEDGYYFFLDTDLTYIQIVNDFSYYKFGYPSGQRLQIGFLKGF